jgi:hypothetical protein
MTEDNAMAENIPADGRFASRIGALESVNGYPSESAVAGLFDELDFQRAVQSYLWAFPAVSNQSMKTGMFRDLGATRNDIFVVDNFLDTKGRFLTGNTTTIYALTFIDLAKDGPVVIEVPAGPTAGMVNDFWFRCLTEIGRTGPDAGKGGKFLLLPPDHAGGVDAPGHFIVRASMSDLNVLIRGFVQGDDVAAAAGMMNTLRVYPYSQRESPQQNRHFACSGKAIDTLDPDGIDYWKRLSEVVNNNPVEERDRFFMAMLRPLGIEKGRAFSPDFRQQGILEEGARVGRAMAAANTFATRLPDANWYPGTQWMASILLDPSQEAEHHTQLDERLHWFFIATYMNPHMAQTKPGPGSVYIQSFKDKAGNWFDSAKNYRLRVPANAPAQDFWSITVYDTKTRSMIQNAANKSALTSREALKLNDDGSLDLWFGPTPPQGLETNWVDTRPSEGFFIWFRAYSPTAAYFDKTWSLPDVERIE